MSIPWWHARLFAMCAMLLAMSWPCGGFASQPEPLDPPDPPAKLLAIVQPLGDFVLREVGPTGCEIGYLAAGAETGRVEVTYGGDDQTPRVRTAHYSLTIWSRQPLEDTGALVRAADAIVAADGGLLPAAPVRVRAPQRQAPQRRTLVLWTVGMGCLALALAIWRRGRLYLEVRRAHLVQACVHTSIFVYWSLYWPGVRYQAPDILLMIGLAYASEAAFAFLRNGRWRVGLAPLPVVFSTNLFIWLNANGAVLAMVGAFACKTFIQRNGRHIFNPSVAGLTLNAFCTIVFPGFVYFTGTFHTLNMAPNMAEWIFLTSLIPLTMFGLLPVSIGAIIGLHFFTHAPGALRPTLVLMMTLLATDPATTPKLGLGRLLFGFFVGSTYVIYRAWLAHMGQPDDFAKILSVPLANVLVPQFDAVARWATASAKRGLSFFDRALVGFAAASDRLRRTLSPAMRFAPTAVWAVLFIIANRSEKARYFEPAMHWSWGTPLVIRDADDVPRCASNPIFCQPFTLIQEARLWRGGGKSGTNDRDLGVIAVAGPVSAPMARP